MQKVIAMYKLVNLFRPIIAKPQNTTAYVEISPCNLLKPYIKCYWGSPQPLLKFRKEFSMPRSTIIIPDTCMDIIVNIDYHSNKISSVFCGINDAPFCVFDVNKTTLISTFAIRFNFWAVHLFSDIGMKESLNAFVDINEYFNDFKRKLESMLIEKTIIEERVFEVEKYLIKRLFTNYHINNNVMNAIYFILNSKGLISVSELSNKTNISPRQLQRLILEFVGVSPKKITDLVRFQNIWQVMYYSHKQDFGDIVYHYKYADQSHFNNDFKKYAGRTPTEALKYAKT